MPFIYWWQHLPENLSPVIFEIGPISLRYYGMMYVVAFTIVYFMARYRLRTEDRFHLSGQQLNDLITAMIVGLILGARTRVRGILQSVLLSVTPSGNPAAF